jgi:hypothetical protein
MESSERDPFLLGHKALFDKGDLSDRATQSEKPELGEEDPEDA